MAIYLKKKLKVMPSLSKEVEFINEIDSKKPHVRIGILNLMPTLEDTERQFILAFENPIIQIELDFIYLDTKRKDEEKENYFKNYYYAFREIKQIHYDGMLVTGAPLEHIQYQNIEYIEELKEFFKYTKTNVSSTIFLCWASQFGLQYFYGVNRYNLKSKVSGVYEHYIVNKTKLIEGFDEYFYVPQSRYCSIVEKEILKQKDLILTSKSNETGAYLVESLDGSKIFVTGHAEYDLWTLNKEYRRDINKGLDILLPKNYYKENDPNNKPVYRWHSVAYLLYHNWIYYYVYKKSLQ